jgi:hypothetical protein
MLKLYVVKITRNNRCSSGNCFNKGYTGIVLLGRARAWRMLGACLAHAWRTLSACAFISEGLGRESFLPSSSLNSCKVRKATSAIIARILDAYVPFISRS